MICEEGRDSKDVRDWLSKHKGYQVGKDFVYLCWRSENTGHIVGVAVFEHYTFGSVQIHIDTIKGLTRKMIRDICNYVYETAKCEVLLGFVRASDKRALNVFSKVGFIFIAQIPLMYKNDHGILIALYKEHAKRWY